MTREAFVRKWLANPEKEYTEHHINEMYDDIDKFIDFTIKTENLKTEEQWKMPS